MSVPEADGVTEVTLRGPGLQNTRQDAAQRDPACAAKRRRRRKGANTRRSPKNVNVARRRATRTNLKSPVLQWVKGRCLQKNHPVLRLVPLPVSDVCLGGAARPRCPPESRDLTPGTHLVDPDLEGGPGPVQGLTQDPGALEVGPGPDPDLSPIRDRGRDRG